MSKDQSAAAKPVAPVAPKITEQSLIKDLSLSWRAGDLLQASGVENMKQLRDFHEQFGLDYFRRGPNAGFKTMEEIRGLLRALGALELMRPELARDSADEVHLAKFAMGQRTKTALITAGIDTLGRLREAYLNGGKPSLLKISNINTSSLVEIDDLLGPEFLERMTNLEPSERVSDETFITNIDLGAQTKSILHDKGILTVGMLRESYLKEGRNAIRRRGLGELSFAEVERLIPAAVLGQFSSVDPGASVPDNLPIRRLRIRLRVKTALAEYGLMTVGDLRQVFANQRKSYVKIFGVGSTGWAELKPLLKPGDLNQLRLKVSADLSDDTLVDRLEITSETKSALLYQNIKTVGQLRESMQAIGVLQGFSLRGLNEIRPLLPFLAEDYASPPHHRKAALLTGEENWETLNLSPRAEMALQAMGLQNLKQLRQEYKVWGTGILKAIRLQGEDVLDEIADKLGFTNPFATDEDCGTSLTSDQASDPARPGRPARPAR